LKVAEVGNIHANFKIDMDALDAVDGYDPDHLAKVKQTLEFNEKALIYDIEVRLKSAHNEEEAEVLQAM
jgi:hypothetical protein